MRHAPPKGGGACSQLTVLPGNVSSDYTPPPQFSQPANPPRDFDPITMPILAAHWPGLASAPNTDTDTNTNTNTDTTLTVSYEFERDSEGRAA